MEKLLRQLGIPTISQYFRGRACSMRIPGMGHCGMPVTECLLPRYPGTYFQYFGGLEALPPSQSL
eukprot:2054585-Rhodomonas_salina.3